MKHYALALALSLSVLGLQGCGQGDSGNGAQEPAGSSMQDNGTPNGAQPAAPATMQPPTDSSVNPDAAPPAQGDTNP